MRQTLNHLDNAKILVSINGRLRKRSCRFRSPIWECAAWDALNDAFCLFAGEHKKVRKQRMWCAADWSGLSKGNSAFQNATQKKDAAWCCFSWSLGGPEFKRETRMVHDAAWSLAPSTSSCSCALWEEVKLSNFLQANAIINKNARRDKSRGCTQFVHPE